MMRSIRPGSSLATTSRLRKSLLISRGRTPRRPQRHVVTVPASSYIASVRPQRPQPYPPSAVQHRPSPGLPRVGPPGSKEGAAPTRGAQRRLQDRPRIFKPIGKRSGLRTSPGQSALSPRQRPDGAFIRLGRPLVAWPAMSAPSSPTYRPSSARPGLWARRVVSAGLQPPHRRQNHRPPHQLPLRHRP
jgi:hypothetical protein